MAKVIERSLYETDYYDWTKQQAAELRRLAKAPASSTLDLENLAEEIESLARSDWRTVRSQAQRIIEHLLRLEHSPAANPRLEWRASVDQARDGLEDHLTPSLRREVEADLKTVFGRARRDARRGLQAEGETESANSLPETCPYTFQKIIRHGWYPNIQHGLADEGI